METGNASSGRALRFAFFLASIFVGLVLGLVFGWLVQPGIQPNFAASTLREDYQTDYVLMVSEIYQREQEVEKAARRLALLGDQPYRQVQEAITTAHSLGYAQTDLETMAALSQALQFLEGDLP